MDAMLQEHGAKHVYRIPEGLRELCSDISREVLRSQPNDIYRYIADYIEALITTRENAKVAFRVVSNIMLGSEAIVEILRDTGLDLGQIAVAAPRLQKAFREYLDLVDVQPGRMSEDRNLEDTSKSSICEILEETGASSKKAEKAASLIQAAFRGQYEKMVEQEEAKGDKVEWERAAKSTTEILKRAGVSETEAEKAATLIQSAYRGYYTRRNMRIKLNKANEKPDGPGLAFSDLPEARETIQAVASLDMMYEDSRLDSQRANEAATLIQRSYRAHRSRRRSEESRGRTSSGNSLVVDAIVKSVEHKIIEKVLSSRDNIPQEFEMEERDRAVTEKIETSYKERFRESRLLAKTENDETHENFPSTNDDRIESAKSFDSKEPKLSQRSNVSLEETRFDHPDTHSQHDELSGEEE